MMYFLQIQRTKNLINHSYIIIDPIEYATKLEYLEDLENLEDLEDQQIKEIIYREVEKRLKTLYYKKKKINTIELIENTIYITIEDICQDN